MEALNRKPFQGIGNILRFNWHYYAAVFVALVLMHLVKSFTSPSLHPFIGLTGLLLILATFVSLAVSFYIYDLSGLYNLRWLNIEVKTGAQLLNVHAGFDETSALLAAKYPRASLTVFDSYDPQKHTELSIKRAKKAYPAYANTQVVSTSSMPLRENAIDVVFCVLSAHEIRDSEERTFFFQQLYKALKKDGKIIVVEHLRDWLNFLAYAIGAFHFHSATKWKKTFSSAGLVIEREQKLTPFIRAYYLQKNRTAP